MRLSPLQKVLRRFVRPHGYTARPPGVTAGLCGYRRYGLYDAALLEVLLLLFAVAEAAQYLGVVFTECGAEPACGARRCGKLRHDGWNFHRFAVRQVPSLDHV